MKKLLALIVSIGMCFGCVACGDGNSSEIQSPESPSTTQKPIDDICDLSNSQTQELANKLREASVYPTTYGDNNIVAERLRVYQAKTLLNDALVALEEAKNSRTIRVYNSETGQWEMCPDEKAIESATQEVVIFYNLLGGTILNANTTIEGATYGKVIEELENFTATTSSLQIILDDSLKYYEKLPQDCMQYSKFPEYTKESPAWINDISKIVKDFCGIEL